MVAYFNAAMLFMPHVSELADFKILQVNYMWHMQHCIVEVCTSIVTVNEGTGSRVRD